MDTYEILSTHFAELSATLLTIDREELKKAIEILHQAKEDGAWVWIAGNGGSSATASHFANDLTKMAGIKAACLSDMTPTMMAYGNDDGWNNMFSHILHKLSGDEESGDVLVAISCSGNSANVVEAAKWFGENIIVLTGNVMNSKLAELSPNAIIHALSSDITIQEDVHTAVCHALAKALRD